MYFIILKCHVHNNMTTIEIACIPLYGFALKCHVYHDMHFIWMVNLPVKLKSHEFHVFIIYDFYNILQITQYKHRFMA